ncbi:unnamed protein product [Ilex paraguariensis]|uniref:Strictosidine synthase conserved region domain-containing protein n=1 Tax=Ilex paraguariensis TaxID=185542 RepID=A0ABC8RWD1_9AQUA
MVKSSFCFPWEQVSSFIKPQLPSNATAPESFAFDFHGGGPYTGISDGRIVKYEGSYDGFVDFAFTASTRSKALCDGITNLTLSPICGLPLGLSFNYVTRNLYAVDPFIGLTVVGPHGGLATTLATSADGVPFSFLVGVDTDPLTGIVYFTDASAIYGPSNVTESIRRAVGTAASGDGTFALVSEFIGKRIQKYWLEGPKANIAETFMTFDGNPNKIKRNPLGDFWVAVNYQTYDSTPVAAPVGLRIITSGKVIETVDLSDEYNQRITTVQQQLGSLYIGTRFANFVGVYKI